MALKMKSLPVRQAGICLILLLGLTAYLVLSLVLRAGGSVENPKYIDELDRAALQLFMPYLAVAVGGLFGTAHLVDPKPDPYRFWVAAFTLIVWDLLVVGYVFLIVIGKQYVEDFLSWSGSTLPVLSTLVAAIMAYYFGAQTEQRTGQGAPAQQGAQVTP